MLCSWSPVEAPAGPMGQYLDLQGSWGELYGLRHASRAVSRQRHKQPKCNEKCKLRHLASVGPMSFVRCDLKKVIQGDKGTYRRKAPEVHLSKKTGFEATVDEVLVPAIIWDLGRKKAMLLQCSKGAASWMCRLSRAAQHGKEALAHQVLKLGCCLGVQSKLAEYGHIPNNMVSEFW